MVEADPEQLDGRGPQRGAHLHTGPESLLEELAFVRDRRIALALGHAPHRGVGRGARPRGRADTADLSQDQWVGARFEGFGPGAVGWFEGIEADNSRDRFAATKGTWEADVVGPLDALLEELAAGTDGDVKRFRQHRDVRFSKDKAPYKTTTYGIATVPGSECARYVQLSSAGL